MNLDTIKKIYFIGIGGIGMSALARYFNGRGVVVFGYDKVRSSLTDALSAEGMTIHYKDDVSFIPEDIDLAVYTPAVPSSHRELTYFRNNGFPVKKRAAVLGIISRGMKAIAVAGTHGKTTTTSITTHVLRTVGIDCTAFLGGIAQNFSSNFVEGQSDWVVIEADEFDRSFLHLNPTVAAVTSMDADHLDIYGTKAEMHRGFAQFVSQTYAGGQVYVRHGLPLKLSEIVSNQLTITTYGIEEGEAQSKNVRVEDGFFVFDYQKGNHLIEGIKFTLPGKHNIENATVAISVALQLGATDEAIKEALRTFKGIKRRFEFVVRKEDKVFIDDYAHHPSELRAAIGAARMLYPDKKITGIFQPHLYSRTNDFADGFAAALDLLDEVILLPIYPARELPMEGVNSEMILKRMKNPNRRLVAYDKAVADLDYKNIEVLMTLGAGDIDRLVGEMARWFDCYPDSYRDV